MLVPAHGPVEVLRLLQPTRGLLEGKELWARLGALKCGEGLAAFWHLGFLFIRTTADGAHLDRLHNAAHVHRVWRPAPVEGIVRRRVDGDLAGERWQGRCRCCCRRAEGSCCRGSPAALLQQLLWAELPRGDRSGRFHFGTHSRNRCSCHARHTRRSSRRTVRQTLTRRHTLAVQRSLAALELLVEVPALRKWRSLLLGGWRPHWRVLSHLQYRLLGKAFEWRLHLRISVRVPCVIELILEYQSGQALHVGGDLARQIALFRTGTAIHDG
mmetsp:Transcript_32066/g.76547  ORF Transcript_32066/g.76547 Transcript_32066/m.76547 type:complete len:270 (+) Transcript_32066:677-1486(+)